MKKILVTLPVRPDQEAQLHKIAPHADFTFAINGKASIEQVHMANIILGSVPPKFLKGAESLEWLQLNSAGTGGYTNGILKDGVILTNASGSYGLAISEHLLAMAMALQKKLHMYLLNQQNALWQDEGPITSMFGATVLVVGLGDIGGEFAKRCKCLGSHTIGIRRVAREKPDYVDAVYTMEQLDDLLPKADIVALSLPQTKETTHLFSADRFKRMKKGAILLNVGRGSAIDQEALIEALASGQLGGAGLDVTDPEPLPDNHPLWDAENLILTPHVSGGYHLAETQKRLFQLSAGNLKKYLAGEKMDSVVDFETGYRKISES